MPECHVCPHNGQGHAECLTCKGPSEPGHHGRVHISIDSGMSEQGQSLGEVLASQHAVPTVAADEIPEALDTARAILGFMLTLSEVELRVLAIRLSTDAVPTAAAIGRSVGLSRTGAVRAMKRIRDKLPRGASRWTRRLFDEEHKASTRPVHGDMGSLACIPIECADSVDGVSGPVSAYPEDDGDP